MTSGSYFFNTSFAGDELVSMNVLSAAFICASSEAVGRCIATSGGTGAEGPIWTGVKPPRPPWPRPGAAGAGAPAGPGPATGGGGAAGAVCAQSPVADAAPAMDKTTRSRNNRAVFMYPSRKEPDIWSVATHGGPDGVCRRASQLSSKKARQPMLPVEPKGQSELPRVDDRRRGILPGRRAALHVVHSIERQVRVQRRPLDPIEDVVTLNHQSKAAMVSNRKAPFECEIPIDYR